MSKADRKPHRLPAIRKREIAASGRTEKNSVFNFAVKCIKCFIITILID